jgi:hypothetical protein
MFRKENSSTMVYLAESSPEVGKTESPKEEISIIIKLPDFPTYVGFRTKKFMLNRTIAPGFNQVDHITLIKPGTG